MARRRGVSPEELDQITKLREAGLSWLKIHQETGVPRRSAKLAYEKWQKSLSVTELKAARINVATEIFKNHIKALVHFARYIATELTIPYSTWVSADEHLNTLLGKEITGQPDFYDLPQTNDRHRSKSVLRHNQLLYKALQDHTRGKISWDTLDNWRTAWDDFIELFGKIRKRVSKKVEEKFKDNKELLLSIGASGNNDVIECIVDTIIDGIRKDIIDNNIGSDEPLVRKSLSDDSNIHMLIRSMDNKEIFQSNNVAHAHEVMEIFDSVNAMERELMRLKGSNEFEEEIKKMQTAIDELDDILDPIALYPILLSTRCDFCPV